MRRRQHEIETFGLSFLDVISCGFGAVILLLIIVLAFEPSTVQQLAGDLRQRISDSAEMRTALAAEQDEMARALEEKQRRLAALQARLEALGAEWEAVERQFGAAQARAQVGTRMEAQLHIVRQTLSEEMKKLLGQEGVKTPDEDAPIGGIPMDSNYVIFLIDTSGSMKAGAWPLVVRKVQEILNTYPKVEGFQVLNDQGTYMFPSFAGQWIPDSPARRAVVLERLRSWDSFSASNPAPGILQAIRTFHRSDRKTSIFVFGDDFNGSSIDEVVHAVSRLNRKNAQGESQVRIHTFGFPVLPLLTLQRENFTRFAHMMRILAERNSGSFVGLNALR